MKTTEEKFSYFKKGVTEVIPLMEVSLPAVYGLIKSSRLKEVTEKIRSGKALKTRDLPSACFSGTFKSRGLEGLLEYSGLICLDIDDFDFAPSLKERISKDSFLNPVLSFISPRGKGLKIIVRIKDAVPEKHGLYFDLLAYYFKAVFGIKIDASGRDVSRLCFICHDPEPFFFEDGFISEEALLRLQPKMEEMMKKAEKETPVSASAIFVNTLRERRKSRLRNLSPDTFSNDSKPSDLLNRIPAVHELAEAALRNHGWKQKGEHWTRPGKEGGTSAVFNFFDREGIYMMTNFSTNSPGFGRKGYTDVSILTELDYQGDFKKCISELAHRFLNQN